MSDKGIKRKKKSFFQKSKKFYKKGVQGKGVRIDEESFEYFLHVLKIMNQEFESEEDKASFVENVFEQLAGNEVSYSCNQVVSRIVDNLLPLACDSTLFKFMDVFSENIRIVSIDPFASFVLQKLIINVTERFLILYSNENNDDCNNPKCRKYNEWLLKITKFVLNNFEEFVFDNYANHIMRVAVSCLVGKPQVSSVKSASDYDNKNLPPEFTTILKSFVDQFLKWPRFAELPFQNLSSGFLQVLLQCVAKVSTKRSKYLGRKLLDECFTSGALSSSEECKLVEIEGAKEEKLSIDFLNVPSSFNNDASVRLLEVVLSVASVKLFTQIYAKCFINRLSILSCHPTANFAVQKLIRYCQEKSEFESIFEELSSSFETVLENGRNGVILQLCEGCLRHKTKQSVFLQLWMKYLDCNEPKESQILLVPLTIFLKRKREYDQEENYHVQLHGSLMVQHMLQFNKPIKIVASLLEMKGKSLTNIFCNPKGCHVADAFFESEFVGEKSKEKLFKALNDCYTSLATSKHGSRVFDIIWRWASLKNRVLIASELLENEAKLNNNPFGRPIIYNLSLGSFRRNKDEWIKAQTATNTAKKLFADIVSET